MKSKEVTYRLFIMVAMAVLLVIATLAWFVDTTNVESDSLLFGSSDLRIKAVLHEGIIAQDGSVSYGEEKPFDEQGNAKIEISGLVPGQKKIYKITLTNEGEPANVSLGMHRIELGKYSQIVNGVPTEMTSVLDKLIFYSLSESATVPTAEPTVSIFTQRNGTGEIAGTEQGMATGEVRVFHGVFLYDPSVQSFEGGTLTLQFGILATLS